MKDFREWMDKNRKGLDGRLCTRMTLKSGLSMSVQASEYAYCSPRETLDSYVHYSEFEVGFPSEVVESLLEYAEDLERPTDTVYGYVPAEVIQKIVDDNGGIEEAPE